MSKSAFSLLILMVMVMASMLIAGCGKGAPATTAATASASTQGSSLAAAVQGVDLSGTYTLRGVQCFDPNTVALTATGLFSFSSGGETLTIHGNSAVTVDTGTGCTATETDHVVFGASGGTSLATLTVSEDSVTTSTGSACDFPFTLQAVNGTAVITRSPVSLPMALTDTPGSSSRTAQTSYVWNPTHGTIEWVDSSYAVQGSPGDICFVIYEQ